MVIVISLVLTHRTVQSNNYLIDRNARQQNDDERRLLESQTPEEEAESLLNDTRQFNSITQAAEKLISVTATAADSNLNKVHLLFSGKSVYEYYWIRIYCSKLNIFVFKDVNQLANNNASSDSIVPIEELISIDDKNGNMLSWFFGYKKVNLSVV